MISKIISAASSSLDKIDSSLSALLAKCVILHGTTLDAIEEYQSTLLTDYGVIDEGIADVLKRFGLGALTKQTVEKGTSVFKPPLAKLAASQTIKNTLILPDKAKLFVTYDYEKKSKQTQTLTYKVDLPYVTQEIKIQELLKIYKDSAWAPTVQCLRLTANKVEKLDYDWIEKAVSLLVYLHGANADPLFLSLVNVCFQGEERWENFLDGEIPLRNPV